MTTYTREEIERGNGCSTSRPVKAFSYDGGLTWHTCEVTDSICGDPTDVVTIPRGGTLSDGV